MLPYTPINPPTLVRKTTTFGGSLEIDLSNPVNQAAILQGRYFPIQWCYTGIPDQPNPLDIIYTFLPPSTSMTLSLSCELINGNFHTIYDDCFEVLVYGYKTEPPIIDGAVPKSMIADNDYVAAGWGWGEYMYPVFPRAGDPIVYNNAFQQMMTITGAANYWGMLVRPGIVDFDGQGEIRSIVMRAQAELAISTYPASNSVIIHQPYCVPPFMPYAFVPAPSDAGGTYLFHNAPVAPRPRLQNASAVRHFEARFIRNFNATQDGYTAHIWGGPWKIDAVAGVVQGAMPPDITIALEDHTHTPEAAVDSNAYYSPIIDTDTGSSGRVFADFVAHPVVTITHEEAGILDIASGICDQGGI